MPVSFISPRMTAGTVTRTIARETNHPPPAWTRQAPSCLNTAGHHHTVPAQTREKLSHRHCTRSSWSQSPHSSHMGSSEHKAPDPQGSLQHSDKDSRESNQDQADCPITVSYVLKSHTSWAFIVPESWSPLDDETGDDHVKPLTDLAAICQALPPPRITPDTMDSEEVEDTFDRSDYSPLVDFDPYFSTSGQIKQLYYLIPLLQPKSEEFELLQMAEYVGSQAPFPPIFILSRGQAMLTRSLTLHQRIIEVETGQSSPLLKFWMRTFRNWSSLQTP